MEIIKVLSSISVILSVLGMYLNSKGDIRGFYCWLICNPYLIFINLYYKLYELSLLYAIYTVLAVYGIIKWKKSIRKL